MTIRKLLFVDTNIWLDFYRGRSDVNLKLLRHLETISNKNALINTYQVEMEFKKNRQRVIQEELKSLKMDRDVSRPAIFSDSQDARKLEDYITEANKRAKKLVVKMKSALKEPITKDLVYQACQRIFHANSPLNLSRTDKIRYQIRRKAFRRFMHGCPPRKNDDTSIGDAINWEWMVECANNHKAELVIVSRDSDYGVTIDNQSFINDHLKQEFQERVSIKRNILLYSRLSEALKHFKIKISQQEEKEEEKIISSAKAENIKSTYETFLKTYLKQIETATPQILDKWKDGV